MSVATSVLMLALVTAVTCSVAGIFLVIRGQAMLSDAMSHGMLPGIVLAAWVTGSIYSPFLIIGAALMCMLVVVLVQLMCHSKLVSSDAAVGVFFPGLFSIGVIMISTIFSGVHISEHSVFEGDINIASIIHTSINGVDLGPTYFWVMLAILGINLLVIALLWRPLTAASFDPQLSALQGFWVKTLNYIYMFLVAVTITAAFKIAGAILVVALLIIPAATARLLTHRVSQMFFVTIFLTVITTTVAFYVAYYAKLATSPLVAVFEGLVFVLVFVGTQIINKYLRHSSLKREIAEQQTHRCHCMRVN